MDPDQPHLQRSFATAAVYRIPIHSSTTYILTMRNKILLLFYLLNHMLAARANRPNLRLPLRTYSRF